MSPRQSLFCLTLSAWLLCLQGVAPGPATITTTANSTLKLPITVSSEPACLVQLHTAATTGAAATAGSAGEALRPSAATSLAWQARQDLVWEDSSALVLSYARFSDGSVMDVTDKTDVVVAAPDNAGGALPFSLDTDNTTGLHWLNVKIAVRKHTLCTQSLLQMAEPQSARCTPANV